MPPLKVLLADDVQLFVELEKTFFRRQDVTLLVARTGEEAVELVRSERPHLVFMDLFMPKMDGDEACRLIKADPELRFTPVVMVTQGGHESDLARCREAGCDEIVLKPIDRHRFLETAHRFLAIAARSAPRVTAHLQVRFGAADGELLTDYTINLSTGGVFLETSRVLPENSPLWLEFSLPDRSEPIQCRGRVAWTNPEEGPKKPQLPPGMGIQFLDLPMAEMQAIREFMKRHALAPAW